MKQLLFLLTSLLFLSSTLHAEEEPAITFSYAFLYRTKDSEIRTIGSATSSSNLESSDQLKIFLKPEENVYLYLFLHESEGNLYLIYPRFFSDFNHPENTAAGFYFPGGFEWLSFTQGKGDERFYILASSKRLDDLEQAADTYLSVFKKKKTGSECETARKFVLEEIRRLQLENFAYIKKAKRDIRFVAGEFRGFDEVFEFPVQRITGVPFYSRTIRIEH